MENIKNLFNKNMSICIFFCLTHVYVKNISEEGILYFSSSNNNSGSSVERYYRSETLRLFICSEHGLSSSRIK